ncbi:MAG: single-stranded DNA-binding protein [Bacteroidia bacterium]|jgi:single stranded DNA-binding protein|nr:single-stranded DNA-binding protein [Bacteroidia bacterium]
MYARLIVAGRLARDAELRQLHNGQVIRFSVPHRQRLASGEERTLWIECSYWRNTGESTEVLKLLKKGAAVVVEGTPSVRLYTRQDNTPGVSFECRVTNLRVLALATAEAESPVPPESAEVGTPEPEPPIPPDLPPAGEDLPF